MNLQKPLLLLATALSLTAQGIQYRHIDVDAVVTNLPQPQVTFTWDAQANWAPIDISRRVMGGQGAAHPWTARATVNHPTATFTDPVDPGVVYEYRLHRPYDSAHDLYNEVSAFVAVALDAPLDDDRGGVLLVVDNSVVGALASELGQLEMDLAGDGWTVERMDYARHGLADPADLRSAIAGAHAASGGTLKALYLFGHLPVVKSGFLNVDGHGARPHAADGFYADVDGSWTDTSIYNGEPGDGIYDPSIFPSALELMPGRVDLANMPNYRKSEIELLRDYIHKSHAFRHGARTDVSRRGLWNSGYLWPERNWINPLFGKANVRYAPFQPELSTNAYLFAIDFGTPSGTDPNYTATANQLVFGINFGSYKQDWNNANNPMRGLLAQPDWGLTCVWGARPSWFFHHMGAGAPVGYSALRSMFNTYSDYMPCGDYVMLSYVHSALMGDPTLRLHPVAPPRALTASMDAAGAVLSWSPSTDPSVLGYHVYMSTARLGPYTRLTPAPQPDLTFTNAAPPAAEHWYQVRAIKREATAAAAYTNASQGTFIRLNANGTANRAPIAQSALVRTSRNRLIEVSCEGSDPDGDDVFPVLLTNPRHGDLRWTDSQLLYVPDRDYAGSDTVVFAMSDGTTTGEPAEVAIEVSPTDNLLSWEFGTPPSNNVPQNLTCTAHADGILPSTITAGPSATFHTGLATYQRDALCLSGGAVGGLDPGHYVEWRVVPEALHRFDISGVSFGLWNQDPAKPVHAALRWSDDGFSTWQAVPIGGQETVTYAGAGNEAAAGRPFAASLKDVGELQLCTNTVAFRLFFWHDAASSYTGIGKIGETQVDLAVSGTAISIAPPVITSADQAEGALGEPFQYTIAAENDPTGFTALGLPNWATLDTETGVISGIPAAAGVSRVTLSATNAWGAGTASLEIVVGLVIEATADEGGTIAPSGRIGLAAGASQQFTITPGAYADIADVIVDGVTVGAVATYLFENVQTSHTIRAVFTPHRTSHGTPLGWLAALGYAGDFESADLADLDNDGVANWIEHRDATDPGDPLSRPAYNAVPYAESFENLAGWGGAYTNVAGRMGWSSTAGAGDRSRLVPGDYTYAGTPPLPAATHTNIMAIDATDAVLSCSLGEGFPMSADLAYVDMMMQAVAAEAPPLHFTADDTGTKAGAYVDAEGRLGVYHGVAAANGAWMSNAVARTDTTVDTNAWFRLTLAFDTTLGPTAPSMFRIWVDGNLVTDESAHPDGWKEQYAANGTLPPPAPGGSWFRFATTDADATVLHAVAFSGNGCVDDLVINTETPFPETVLLLIRRSGPGTTSLGDEEWISVPVPAGVSTQIVYTASDWHRIASLDRNGAAVPAAIGQHVHTQRLANVTATVSNAVVFALATPEQTGQPGVPTEWLAQWSEASVKAAPFDGYDVPTKYILGLDPTASNTYALALDAFALEDDRAVIVAKRTVSGALSPDGMHGWLVLQHADALDTAFTNLAESALTGPDAFDVAGKRAFTNTIPQTAPSGFYRVIVESPVD